MAIVTGLVPNAPTDHAASLNNAQLINTALRTGDGHAEIPAGVYTLADDTAGSARIIGLPDNARLTGAGQTLTTLRAQTGSPLNQAVVANDLHTDTAHTTPNVNLYIADMTVDGNIGNRTSVPNPNSSGCAVTFRCVEDSLIERVYALNGNHSFDVSASVYQDNNLPVTDPGKRPIGPSLRNTLRDCKAGGSGDDAFTTHNSDWTRFERCQAINHEDKPRSGNSNGFEIDDGSRWTYLGDCVSRGFSAAYESKGHPQNIPAQWTTFERCHAEWSRYGFWIFWEDHLGPDGFAYGAVLRDCTATDLGDVLGYDASLGYAYHPSLLVGQYDGVLVENFRTWDSATSCAVFSGGTTHVRVDGIDMTDCWWRPYQPQSRATVQVSDTAGVDIRISNVTVRTAHHVRPSAVGIAGTDCLVENITAETGPIDAWKANTAYEAGEFCYPAAGVVLACITAGTSGSTPPEAPAMNTGVDDGTARWVRTYGSAVYVTGSVTDRKQARQIRQVAHKWTETVTTGTYQGNYTAEPPAPDGWWK